MESELRGADVGADARRTRRLRCGEVWPGARSPRESANESKDGTELPAPDPLEDDVPWGSSMTSPAIVTREEAPSSPVEPETTEADPEVTGPAG